MTLGSVVKADDLFDSLGEEDLQEVRKFVVEKNDVVEGLLNKFRKLLVDVKRHRRPYEVIYSSLKEYGLAGYSRDDITGCSVKIGLLGNKGNFQPMFGFFMSYLLNNSVEGDNIIYTRHLSRSPDYLCYLNEKNVVVKGNGGDFLGTYMFDGSVVLEGDVDKSVGLCMTGGSILIRGNASVKAGYSLNGGSLVVEGNVDDRAGEEMRRGSLVVHGDAADAIGRDMNGGSMEIKGNGGKYVGSRMGGWVVVYSW